MTATINKSRLFTASCMALVVTSMTFAIRAGMIEPMGKAFNLDNQQLGWIIGMAFFGFPVATTIGGFFVDQIGMKRWMWLAFVAHLMGLLLTIFAQGFWTLFISTFLIGFANGSVEAVCNPLVASLYPENKTASLNKFHVWFPGGIVIGALISAFLKEYQMSEYIGVAIMLIPTCLYAYLFFGQNFPTTERVSSGVKYSEMLKAVTSPLFLLMMAAMFFTANSELSTTQWIDKLLGNAGANPLLILALVNGLMAFGRFFGEGIIHRLQPIGVLLISSIFATLGLYLLRTSDGNALYFAAIVFAIGVCYFWPTMLGYVSENMPNTGALGLSLMGGAGMFGNWAYQTFFIGPKLDALKNSGIDELTAGRAIIGYINYMPIVLIIIFASIYFLRKPQKDRA